MQHESIYHIVYHHDHLRVVIVPSQFSNALAILYQDNVPACLSNVMDVAVILHSNMHWTVRKKVLSSNDIMKFGTGARFSNAEVLPFIAMHAY